MSYDPMPRQDVTLPPPIGYISRAEHEAKLREARAEGMEMVLDIVARERLWHTDDTLMSMSARSACDDIADVIRAAAATIRKGEKP